MIETNFDEDLRSYLSEKLDYSLELLNRMVSTNSFTANPEGVNALGKETANIFSELGFRPEFIRSESPFYGDHVILKRTPTANENAPTIGMVSHLDTVYPKDEERKNNFHWRVEGDRIYGPGTVDIKGGTLIIFMILDALKHLHQDLFNSVNWTILLNAAEEHLVHDFKDLCRNNLSDDTLACLVFEGGSYQDNQFKLVVARKGMATFRIEVEGKSAHAGSAHKNGASAILQLAQTISRIGELTDYGNELTFNVGTVAGGTVINRIPHFAAASGEIRAFSPAILLDGIKNLQSLQNSTTISSKNGNYNCRIKIPILERWGPWPRNGNTDSLFAVWQETAESMGYTVVPEERGGLSDGNFLWDFVPTIDGLGPSGGNAHCSERSLDGEKDQEYVLISSFIPKTMLNLKAILNLIDANSPKQK